MPRGKDSDNHILATRFKHDGGTAVVNGFDISIHFVLSREVLLIQKATIKLPQLRQNLLHPPHSVPSRASTGN